MTDDVLQPLCSFRLSPTVREQKMKRRHFVQLGVATGALALTRESLEGAVVPSPPAGVSPAAFELEETTIADLQSAMASGRMTARSITEQYLARIEELDRKGPTLRHV